MKSSGQKEGSIDKKRYVFFSDPDVIVKRAETSAVVSDFSFTCYLVTLLASMYKIPNGFFLL